MKATVNLSEQICALLSKEDGDYATHDYLNASRFPPEGTEEDIQPSSPVSASNGLSAAHGQLLSSEDFENIHSPGPKKRKRTTTAAGNCDSWSLEADRRGGWRSLLCQWAYSVVDHFDLSREIISITMNLFDRFCATVVERHSNYADGVLALGQDEVSLTAMTCLQLAMKLNNYTYIHIPGTRSTMETVVKLGRGAFSLEQVEAKEFELLRSLRWQVHPPTPQVFLHCIFLEFDVNKENSMLNHSKAVQELAAYLIEMSVMDYFFVSHKPSDVALASALCAVNIQSLQTGHPVNTSLLCQLQAHRTYGTEECQERLELAYADSARDEDVIMNIANVPHIKSPVCVAAGLQEHNA